MIAHNEWPVGVCSWSLRSDIHDVIKTLDHLDIDHVHLSVGPAVEENGDEYLQIAKSHDWTITSTMIEFPQEDYSTLESIRKTGGVMPDDVWEENKERFLGAVEATAKLEVPYLSTHAGFLEHGNPEQMQKFKSRVQVLADACRDHDLMLLMETGQETADQLKEFLEEFDHPAIGVNFDPANMILYDEGDPVEAVKTLAPWIKHVHIKDALYTDTPGSWGAEVPWGDGQVGTQSFLNTLGDINYQGALAIEREAGEDRVGDIKVAIERLKT